MLLLGLWPELCLHGTPCSEAHDENSHDYKMNSQEDFETKEK